MFKRLKAWWDAPTPIPIVVSKGDAQEVLSWLEGALNCKNWHWDGDQWACAADAHDRLAKQIGVPQWFQDALNAPAPEITITYGEPEEIAAAEEAAIAACEPARAALTPAQLEWKRLRDQNDKTVAAGDTPSDSEIDMEVEAWNTIRTEFVDFTKDDTL